MSITLALLKSRVIVTPSVSCNIRARFTYFYMSNVLLSPRRKTTSSLTKVAPGTISAGDFIHYIDLKFNRRPKLGGREFLLQGLVRSINNVNSVLLKKTCEGFCDTTNIGKEGHGGGFIFNQIAKHAHQYSSGEGISSGNVFSF